MLEVNFEGADVGGSLFDQCTMERTLFHHTNLEKADFSSATLFNINPNFCKLKGAQFSEEGLRGLVSYLGIKVV